MMRRLCFSLVVTLLMTWAVTAQVNIGTNREDRQSKSRVQMKRSIGGGSKAA
jgi:hypothetical protein